MKTKIRNIYEYVERETGIDLKTRRRRSKEVFARSLFYTLAKEEGATYHELGRWTNKNHATAIHGVNIFPTIWEYYHNLYDKYRGVNRQGNKEIEIYPELEPHEIKYRELPEEKKEKYRVRVEAMLKML